METATVCLREVGTALHPESPVICTQIYRHIRMEASSEFLGSAFGVSVLRMTVFLCTQGPVRREHYSTSCTGDFILGTH